MLRLFVEQAGPVSRSALAEAVTGLTPAQLDRELTRLDAPAVFGELMAEDATTSGR